RGIRSCTLFPYTPLFRSLGHRAIDLVGEIFAFVGVGASILVRAHQSSLGDATRCFRLRVAPRTRGALAKRLVRHTSAPQALVRRDRKSTRLNSSHVNNSN